MSTDSTLHNSGLGLPLNKSRQLDALYMSQIKQIFNQSKGVVESKMGPNVRKPYIEAGSLMKKTLSMNQNTQNPSKDTNEKERLNQSQLWLESPAKSAYTYGASIQQQKVRASVYLKGESTKTFQSLRKENELKEFKIRDLTQRCENLLEKLKKYVSGSELEQEIASMKQYSEHSLERLQSLFRIKSEEIFFKMKLQIIGLLQQFQVPKVQIDGINEVKSQGDLYSFMAKKLRVRLKSFKSKVSESSFEIHKDKVLYQKQQQRIQYLVQTNQLLRLSQTKLKNKIEDLKSQMNQYLDKLKSKERDAEDKQSEIFRLRKQNEELVSANYKLSHQHKSTSSENDAQRRGFEAKEKEMKTLLNSYFLEKKKMESVIEEKQSQIEQILIRERYLQQEIERLNREYVRWKQRYEWLQKDKQSKCRQLQQQKNALECQFAQYQQNHSPNLQMVSKQQLQQAHRKLADSQEVYLKLQKQYNQYRSSYGERERQIRSAYEQAQQQWVEKLARIEKIKQEEMYQQAGEYEAREQEIKLEYDRKYELLIEEVDARMRAIMAENEKKYTERTIQLQSQVQQLRRQIEGLQKIIEVKEAMIFMLSEKQKNQS